MECKENVYGRFTYNKKSERYKLDVVLVQEDSWDKWDTVK